MAFRNYFIMRKPQSGCLEGRTAPLQALFNSFTRSSAETTTAAE